MMRAGVSRLLSMGWVRCADAAKKLGISHQRIATAIKEGELTAHREGHRTFVDWDQVCQRFGEPELPESPQSVESVAELKAELLKWRVHEQKFKAMQVEAAYLESEGKLIQLDKAREGYESAALLVRNNLLGLPNKLAPRLHDAATVAEVRDLLDKAIREAIEEINRVSEKLPKKRG